MREGNRTDLAPQPAVVRDRPFDRGGDFRVEPLAEVFAGKAQAPGNEGSFQSRAEVARLCAQRGGIALVVPGDRLQHQRDVLDRPAKRPDLIQGGGVGDQPETGDTAVGGLQANDAAQRGRLTDRTTGVGTQSGEGLARRERRRAATGGSAGHTVQIPRIAGGMKRGILRGGAHRELVAVVPAIEDRPGLAEATSHGGIVGRGEVGQHPAAGRQRLVPDGDHVLKSDRDPVQRPAAAAGGAAFVRGLGLCPRGNRIRRKERAQPRLDRLRPGDDRFRQLRGGEPAGCQGRRRLPNREVRQRNRGRGHSTTLGTAIIWSRRAGALRNASVGERPARTSSSCQTLCCG